MKGKNIEGERGVNQKLIVSNKILPSHRTTTLENSYDFMWKLNECIEHYFYENISQQN